MPRILFLAPHRPGRSPSQRYRFEQFVPYWESHGFEITTAWTIDEADDLHLYKAGSVWPKARLYFKSRRRRAEHVRTAAEYDIVFLQREMFVTRGTRFERKLAATGVPIIYDFDDAIWLMNVSDGNRKLSWMKDPGKIERILPLARSVIAGNNFLAEFAKRFNPRVEMIPTVVDTERFKPTHDSGRQPATLVIGWTGSRTAMPHLHTALPMLRALKKRSNVPFVLRVICDVPLRASGLEVDYRKWSAATEATDLSDIHIGIMPMVENEWSRGKCGFKGLQYMAMGKPVVLQNHGVNRTIVQHGKNGMLASTREEWIECLLQLMADADLRQQLGAAARTTVEGEYSILAWRDRYLKIFHELIENKNDNDNH